ncbi:MAG TPA: class I SAM-dependent methyltransferase [Chloroflexota bacterium]|nr:class I SAM-dependent methyltransferase [Chloroflexota bacterium]
MTTEPVRTWDSVEAAEVWKRGAARRAQAVAVATEQMLAAAALRPGMRVLDLAAGSGDQSLLAARIVGPAGSVLATDISSSMLAAAEEAADEAGLANIETLVADASTIDLPEGGFDAAICRFGLMFLPDLQAALVRVQRALKPGARFATLVWSTEDKNPYIALQLDVVREMGRLPSSPPTLARTVSLSGPGQLEHALNDAGFQDIQVSSVSTPRDFASLDEAFDAMFTSSPARGELTRGMSEDELEQYAAELKRRLVRFVQPGGRCVLPGEALLGIGVR